MSWTLIESQTLGASAASVTLGSGGTIPQTYKTLKLVVSARSTSTVGDLRVDPNGSSANGSQRVLYGSGSAAASGTDTNIYMIGTPSTFTASTFGSDELTIPNYTSNTNKAMSSDGVQENNAAASYQFLRAQLWSNTAAITSITISAASSNNIAAGSTFTLYGLK